MEAKWIRIGACAVSGALAVFAFVRYGIPWLSPLAELLPNTKSMVVVTGEILTETEKLQSGVGQVQSNLAKVKRQDELLAEQGQLMQGAIAELRQQQALAGRSKGLLADTLAKERTTAALTASAAQAAAASMGTVSANAAELDRLGANTTRIKQSSAVIDGEMDQLLDQMSQSADNFAVVGRIKEAIARAMQRTRDWWPF
jgi:hypothetical protein